MGIRILSLLIVALGLAGCGNGAPRQPERIPQGIGQEAGRVPGEYLLTPRNGYDEERLRQRLEEYGLVSLRALGSGIWLVRLRHDPGPRALAARLEPLAIRVQPNYLYRQQPAPGAPK